MAKRFNIDYNFSSFGNTEKKKPVKKKPKKKSPPNILRGKDLLASKNSSTLLVCGTGRSVAYNSVEIAECAKTHDSIGMEWFCKSKIPTKYYFVRNQAHHSSFISHTDIETVAEFTRAMKEEYQKSILIISDLNRSEYDDYATRWNWARHYKRFPNRKIVIPEKRAIKYKPMNQDFTKSCYRYSYDLFCILQFAVTMKYKGIVLAGFDLVDNRCFWKEGLRQVQRKRDIELEGESVDYQPYHGMLNYYKYNFSKKIYTLDKKSRLIDKGLATYIGSS